MMDKRVLDGGSFSGMIRMGAAELRSNVREINNLNVFPIPDGDTGDNMLMTLIGGIDAAESANGKLGDTACAAAGGMLLSARGNSGVILSQFFDEVSRGFSGLDTADCGQIINAFRLGASHAYSAVVQPAEGTMLTVIREAAEIPVLRILNGPSEAGFRGL